MKLFVNAIRFMQKPVIGKPNEKADKNKKQTEKASHFSGCIFIKSFIDIEPNDNWHDT